MSTPRRKYNVRVHRRGHVSVRFVKWIGRTAKGTARGTSKTGRLLHKYVRQGMCFWTPPFGHEYEYHGDYSPGISEYVKLHCIFCTKEVRWERYGPRKRTIRTAMNEYETRRIAHDQKKKVVPDYL